ncbi:MAG: hypothetical protein AB7D02_00445 [Candidatus Paceibacterota bacterium]
MFFIILILLSGFFLIKIRDFYSSYRYLKREVLKLEKQKNYLLKEKELLEKNLLVDKERALEREARVMMGLKKEGEEVVLVIPSFLENSQNQGPSNLIKEESSVEKMSFLRKIWYNLLKEGKILFQILKRQ